MQFQWGQWYCGVRALNASRIGVGDTQEEAYRDWQVRTSHPAIARAEEARILKILREFDADRALRANPAATTCPECNIIYAPIVIANTVDRGGHLDNAKKHGVITVRKSAQLAHSMTTPGENDERSN